MREGTYTQTLNSLLRKAGVHAWKIAARFANGVPDAWYSGPGGDLWVEYKWVTKMPRAVKPALSAMQAAWLNARLQEGRNVAVVVASPEGALVLTHGSWNDKTKPSVLLSKQELCQWITQQTMCSDPSPSTTSLGHFAA